MSVLIPDEQIEPLLAAHLAAIGTQSPRSLAGRRLTVLRVARFIGQPVAVSSVDDLAGWQREMLHRDKPLKKSSLATALTHLSCYLDWLVRHGHRPDNPTDRLDRPRHAYPHLPRPISETDLARARTHAAPLMRAWLGLGAFCGLRCMEIAGVKRDDIDQGRIRVLGKGGVERTLSLPAVLADELAALEAADTGHLWLNDCTGLPFTATQMSRRINAYLSKLGIAATAHALRHRFGTELYRETRDIAQVQLAMGHAGITTTMGYVKVVGSRQTDDAIERISHVAA